MMIVLRANVLTYRLYPQPNAIYLYIFFHSSILPFQEGKPIVTSFKQRLRVFMMFLFTQ